MKYSKEYFDTNAEDLSSKYNLMSFNDVHSYWAKDYQFEERVVLDIGCGNGRDSLYMAAKGANVTAIDFSKELMKIAKKKDLECKVRWVYQVLPNINDPKILKSKFDLILISAVLMFLPSSKQDETLSIALDLLESKGACIITFKEDVNDFTLHPITPKLESLANHYGCELKVSYGGKDLLGRNTARWIRYILRKV